MLLQVLLSTLSHNLHAMLRFEVVTLCIVLRKAYYAVVSWAHCAQTLLGHCIFLQLLPCCGNTLEQGLGRRTVLLCLMLSWCFDPIVQQTVPSRAIAGLGMRCAAVWTMYMLTSRVCAGFKHILTMSLQEGGDKTQHLGKVALLLGQPYLLDL